MVAGDSSLLTDERLPMPFGRYTLLDRLGSGGMADVYLALATGAFDAKKLVVLKRPRETTSEYVGMFLDEARLAMRLNHPNVVQTYDVGIEHGDVFLAMEYLEGQPLHRVIAELRRQGTELSHPQCARIAADALAGLHYAHDLADYDGTPLQIVHRDVSPHNVFVTYEGQIKVVDFGIAKATMNQVHTDVGSVKGKLAYMAPEHARAQIVDRRADVFVMGIILWELVARRKMLTGATSAELLHKLLTNDFPPLSVEVPTVHPILEAIAMRALQRDPADRYATALEMREALESYISVAKEPARASELGRVIAELFAPSRQQMSTKIRAHIHSSASSKVPVAPAHEATSVTAFAPLPGAPGDLTRVTSMVDMGPGTGDTNGPAVVTPPLPAPRREGRTVVAVAALAASIMALAAVLVLTRRGSSDERSHAPSAAGAGENVAPALPSPEPVIPPVASAPSALASAVPVVPPPPAAAPLPTTPPARPTAARPGDGRPPVASARPSSPRGTRPIDTSFPR